MAKSESPCVQVFSASDCGRCPEAIEISREVANEHGVEVEIVDIESDRSKALSAGVLSVPTVIVGDTQLQGVPTVDRLEQALENEFSG
ncbi:glutaredoxin family protein [Natrononativus amylolyticus]|uniref:glutaredoxin family protein n=1 Tax=Natrononativus amylolyticus TaxID=2963434 RepID=UPI003CE5C74A